jgi:hypothetical protein
MIDVAYRPVNQYNVSTPSGLLSLNLFGYINKADYNTMVQRTRNQIIAFITTSGQYISAILGYDYLISDTNLLYSVNEDVLNYLIPIIIEKFDEIDGYDFSSIEGIRYKIIKSLDNLNYVFNYLSDVTISGGTAYSATFNSFNGQDFYNSYEDCLTYINNETTKMYENLNDTFTFSNNGISTLDSNNIELILASLFNDKIEEIMKVIENAMNLDENDSTIIEIKKEISSVLTKKNTAVNFKFAKSPMRKNEKTISYDISVISQVELTDTMKLLFSRQNSVNDTLNYYRNE